MLAFFGQKLIHKASLNRFESPYGARIMRNAFLRRATLATLVMSLGILSAQAVDQIDKKTLAELSSVKPLQFKLATGPWVTSSAGDTLAAVPLDLKTNEVPCRVKLDEIGYLQVLPFSDLQVAMDGQEMNVTIRKGGLLYGLYDSITLKATSPDSPYAVEVGKEVAQAAVEGEMFASMGVIRLLPSEQSGLEVSNIKGMSKLVAEDAEAIVVATGERYRTDGAEVALVKSDEQLRPVAPEALESQRPRIVTQESADVRIQSEVATAVAAPISILDAQDLIIRMLPGATDDDLSEIAPPHTAASPWSPPPVHRGPLPLRPRLP